MRWSLDGVLLGAARLIPTVMRHIPSRPCNLPMGVATRYKPGSKRFFAGEGSAGPSMSSPMR